MILATAAATATTAAATGSGAAGGGYESGRKGGEGERGGAGRGRGRGASRMRMRSISTQGQAYDCQARQQLRKDGGREEIAVTCVDAAGAAAAATAAAGAGAGGGGFGANTSNEVCAGDRRGALQLQCGGLSRCYSCSFFLSAAIDSSTVNEEVLSSGGSRRNGASRVFTFVAYLHPRSVRSKA